MSTCDAMTTHDAAWDEDRDGPRAAENLVTVPMQGEFYAATKDVLPWVQAHEENHMAHLVVR